MEGKAALSLFLRSVHKRASIAAVLEGLGLGLGVGGLIAWLTANSSTAMIGVLIGAGLVGVLTRVLTDPRRSRTAAELVERAEPGCQNLVFTAAELLANPGTQSHSDIQQLIQQQASDRIAGVAPGAIVPLRGSLAIFIVGLSIGISPLFKPLLDTAMDSLIHGDSPRLRGITLTVTPPAYTGQKARVESNPERIEVLEGSRIEVALQGNASWVRMETLYASDSLSRGEDGRWHGKLIAKETGFVALQGIMKDSESDRVLIGITVVPDLPPRVRLTRPGKDLKLLNGNVTLDLALDADDDIGLAHLSLKYTKVSGSGENFSFAEGEVPLNLARKDGRVWAAQARWDLTSLELGPGDMVVYQGVVRDGRPDGLPVESDAFIAEVLAPGSIALAGYDTDPELERYALSQQMVILKTERLLAEKATLARDSFVERATLLAAEQRSVRAEFVFMMGGEMASVAEEGSVNEEEHAELEAEMMDGHAKNQGREALTKATRLMSQAIASLNEAEVEAALPHEKRALDELQKAFSHSRILLRALSQQERLDFSRRLTGTLTDVARNVRPSIRPDTDPGILARREILTRMTALLTDKLPTPADQAASSLAEAVLRINPADSVLQTIAESLTRAAVAYRSGERTAADLVLGQAALLLSQQLRNGAFSSISTGSVEGRKIQGALRDRRGGT